MASETHTCSYRSRENRLVSLERLRHHKSNRIHSFKKTEKLSQAVMGLKVAEVLAGNL